MPYDIKNYKGSSVASVADGTVNTQTPLKLIGQNYKNYGSLIAENFVHLIENFSRDVEPTNAMVGQLWYKPTDGYLYILDQDSAGNKKWKSLATIQVANAAPTDSEAYEPREGDFWFNSAADKGILNIRYKDDTTGNLQWAQLSVPVSSSATLLFQNVNDNTSNNTTAPKSHATIKFVVDNKVLAILSSDDNAWTPHNKVQNVTPGGTGTATVYGIETHPDGTPLANEFPYIQTGLTLSQPYDPDASGSTPTPGYEYPVIFSAPATGGTRAEAYPLINADGSVHSIVVTNPGSGYTSVPTAEMDPGQDANDPPTLTAVIGDDTDTDDKVISVTVDINDKGSGYRTPNRKPTLNGSIRVGENPKEFVDLRGLASGFGRSINDITIIDGGTGYSQGDAIDFAAGTGGTGATGWTVGSVSSGAITSISAGQPGTGFTYAPSTANSGITTSGGNSAQLLAVLGDNRFILDSNAISGDKIHGGNISAFESSAISDLTTWKFNDPGIGGLTLNDGAVDGQDVASHQTDQDNNGYPAIITFDDDATTQEKLRIGYAEIAFEREQTTKESAGTHTADGGFRIKGGTHIAKNLHVNGNVSISGSLHTQGAVNNIETANLVIEDNLIELNKSQTDLGNNNAFDGVSGLYIDRGLDGSGNAVPKSTFLWDDGADDFGDADYWRVAHFNGITESSTPGDPADRDTLTYTSGTKHSSVNLGNIDSRIIMASEGAKLDVVSDNRSRAGTYSGSRSKGGHLSKYNGFDQDITSTSYPYNADNDFIIVDQDERILRGEFHFYRDAFPCDGSDASPDAANMNDGGISSTGVSAGQITFAGSAVGVVTKTFVPGSGGPNYVGSAPSASGDVTIGSNAITDASPVTISDVGFLDDPVYMIDDGDGAIALFREGRTIGWRRPRVVLYDTKGTGAYAINTVGADGTIGADPTVLTKGKNYVAPKGFIVGEANDSVTAATVPAQGVSINTITATNGEISAIAKSGTGSNYRKQKPFKEINATKFNGAFCADPAQGNITSANALETTPGVYRDNGFGDGSSVADSDNKYVGAYPVMDGHNDRTITSGTFPYVGGGMTLGTQHHHFIDTYTRNIRVENPENTEEELTILSRNTNDGTAAHAKVNIVATNSNDNGSGSILVRAQSGTTKGNNIDGKIVYEAISAGGEASHLMEAKTSDSSQSTSTSTITLKASGSYTTNQSTTFPYNNWHYIADDGATHTVVLGSGKSKTTGNDINIQATNSVNISSPISTTTSVDRFEVHANATRFTSPNIFLGDSTLIPAHHSPSGSTTWGAHIFFGANIASNVYPDFDSNGAGGFDLGAYKDDFTINDHANNSSGTAPNQRWRTIYVRNISAGANDQTGTITGDWSLTAGSTFQATYTADLAERYEADGVIEPGTVVSIGGDKEITVTSTENDTEVFGVISTEPAFIMNGRAGTDETHPMVAMTGRCPCKVVGKINKGDRLVSSSTSGRARKADLTNDSVFAIIGRALESHDSDGEGTIEIAVTRN